ncbi:MAG: NAD regulator [Bauldia sp.]
MEIGLNAAIVAVAGANPLILVTKGAAGEPAGLPFGPFDPLAHRTFEVGLRAFVAEQTALSLGYVEQLYTFGDRGRHMRPGDVGPHVVSVGYLALTRLAGGAGAPAETPAGAEWRGWYEFFPWEDWREGRPPILDETILPALRRFARGSDRGARGVSREERIALAFDGEDRFDEERALDRYELIYEAGLVPESARDGRPPAEGLQGGGPPAGTLGVSLRFDHRRILATAISRLRGKMKYRPVVFELLPDTFTLRELQQTVEAIAGRHLHTQNFRRQVEAAELVEPTGGMSGSNASGRGKAARGAPLGRPAALFRFRREVVRERPAPGTKPGR